MKRINPEIRKLIRELEQGKKKLRVEYNKGLRALDEAIKALDLLAHKAGDVTETLLQNKIKLNSNRNFNSNSGKRGRPAGGESLSREIRDVIASRKKFLHQRDIVAALKKRYPEEDELLFRKKISVLLSNLKKKGVLITINEGNYKRNMFWGIAGTIPAKKKKV